MHACVIVLTGAELFNYLELKRNRKSTRSIPVEQTLRLWSASQCAPLI